MLKSLKLLLVGSLITTLSGCASSSCPCASASVTGPNLNGTWMGSTVTGVRGMTLQLRHAGADVTGTLAADGPLNGPIQGIVDGNMIKLAGRSGLGKAPWLSVKGDLMTGQLGDVVVNFQRVRDEDVKPRR